MNGRDALRVRAVLGRRVWGPPEEFGPDGWILSTLDRGPAGGTVIVSDGPAVLGDPTDYRHASLSWGDRTPSYADLALLHRAVWGESGWSCQVFVPFAEHVNIAATALHLWGAPSGRRLLPPFGDGTTI